MIIDAKIRIRPMIVNARPGIDLKLKKRRTMPIRNGTTTKPDNWKPPNLKL